MEVRFSLYRKTKDPDDPEKTIGAYALTSWADPGDKKNVAGACTGTESCKRKLEPTEVLVITRYCFVETEDETGKPLCVPVAYDNKGIVILRAKIDCDTPSNEVMGAALFIMGAIGIAFVIHQSSKQNGKKN